MLASARFNSKTYAERVVFMDSCRIDCIYGVPLKIKPGIPLNTLLFVVEMNNEKNQIEGIGLIRNMISETRHRVYADYNYNRYIYEGKYRITREEMEDYDKDIVDILISYITHSLFFYLIWLFSSYSRSFLKKLLDLSLWGSLNDSLVCRPFR